MVVGCRTAGRVLAVSFCGLVVPPPANTREQGRRPTRQQKQRILQPCQKKGKTQEEPAKTRCHRCRASPVCWLLPGGGQPSHWGSPQHSQRRGPQERIRPGSARKRPSGESRCFFLFGGPCCWRCWRCCPPFASLSLCVGVWALAAAAAATLQAKPPLGAATAPGTLAAPERSRGTLLSPFCGKLR